MELDVLVADPALGSLLDLASAAAGGAAIAVTDAEGQLLVGGSPTAGGQSLPVCVDDETIGHVVCDASTPPAVASLVRAALELAISGSRDDVTQARAAQELAIGRQIQRSLLPRSFPDVPGWRFAAEYEPAREVGGDLYDVYRLGGDSDDVVVLLIADVTGKGVPAALLMADTKALLRAAADHAPGPADALARVNRILTLERRSSLFVTAALAEIDVWTGGVRLASAGHESPLVVRTDGRVETISASGFILGAVGDAGYEEGSGSIGPGETVLLYTDGVTEARNPQGAFYGEARLRTLLGGLASATADDVRRAVVEDVGEFRAGADAHDDLTILVAERQE